MAEGGTCKARISRAEVEHAARLARLALTEDEIEQLTVDLAKILEHAALVSALDTTDVPPTSHPIELVNVLRPDVPRPGSARAREPRRRRRPLPRPAHPERGTVAAGRSGVGCTRIRAPGAGAAGSPSRARRRPEARKASGCSANLWIERRRSEPHECGRYRRGGPVGRATRHRRARGASRPHRGRRNEIRAFNLVLEADSRAASRRRRRGGRRGPRSGAARRRSIALKGQPLYRGVTTTCSSQILEGWKPPYDATVVDRLLAAKRSSWARPTSTSSRWARRPRTRRSARPATRAIRAAFRADRRAGRPLPSPPDSRPWRSDPTPAARSASPRRFAAWSAQTDLRHRLSRYGLIAAASSLDQIGPFATTVADAALLLETMWGHDPLRTRPRSPPTIDRPRGTLDDGVDAVFAGRDRRRAHRRRRHRRRARLRSRPRGGPSRREGATVERVSLPSSVYGSAYYLIAPAEASSNLARYDGVRYGTRSRVDAADVADDERVDGATRASGPEVKRRIMLGTYALSAGYYDAYYGQGATGAHADHPRLRARTSTSTCCSRRPRRRSRSSSVRRPPIRSRCT